MVRKQPNLIDIHVGARVRLRRLMLNMSRQRLAQDLHLTLQDIQQYEQGASRIDPGRLQQFSTVLRVPVTFFFKGLPSAIKAEPAANDTSEPWSEAPGARRRSAGSRVLN